MILVHSGDFLSIRVPKLIPNVVPLSLLEYSFMNCAMAGDVISLQAAVFPPGVIIWVLMSL